MPYFLKIKRLCLVQTSTNISNMWSKNQKLLIFQVSIYCCLLFQIYLLIFYPWSAIFKIINFHLLQIVSRYRDPQFQVGANYTYVYNLRPNICKSWYMNTYFVPNNSDFTSANKTEYATLPTLSAWGPSLHVRSLCTSVVFSRRNLTSVDARFWPIKKIPALKKYNISNGRRPIT